MLVFKGGETHGSIDWFCEKQLRKHDPPATRTAAGRYLPRNTTSTRRAGTCCGLRMLISDPETITECEHPDSTNPYMQGDKVTHNGKTWISDIDGNVWEPGVYGWSEATE